MKNKKLRFGKGFRVAFGNKQSQAAEMVLEPGKSKAGRTIAIAAAINGSMSLPGQVLRS